MSKVDKLLCMTLLAVWIGLTGAAAVQYVFLDRYAERGMVCKMVEDRAWRCVEGNVEYWNKHEPAGYQ